jgi:hypothetical protein
MLEVARYLARPSAPNQDTATTVAQDGDEAKTNKTDYSGKRGEGPPKIQYLMSSNSPSGGMKEIVLSESNLPRRTH